MLKDKIFGLLGANLVLLCLALMPLSATSTENYSRWLHRIGGEMDYIRHSTNGMWMHGAGTSWIIQSAYIKKQVKLELDMQFGFAPMDIHGSYATFATNANIIKTSHDLIALAVREQVIS